MIQCVIARAGKPVARLTPIVATESRSGVRYGGINYKKLKLSGHQMAVLVFNIFELYYKSGTVLAWVTRQKNERTTA